MSQDIAATTYLPPYSTTNYSYLWNSTFQDFKLLYKMYMQHTVCFYRLLKWNSANRAGVSRESLGSPPDEQFTEVIFNRTE